MINVTRCKASTEFLGRGSIPKDMRKKFDSKIRKCILLGYGNVKKGYRLYDRDKGLIIFSCNVRFDEDESMELLPTIETGRENQSD